MTQFEMWLWDGAVFIVGLFTGLVMAVVLA